MDVSALAAIAAGFGVIGAMIWLTAPRQEDEFDRSMAELFELTSGRVLPDGSGTDGRASRPRTPQGAPVSSIITGQAARIRVR